VVKQGGAIFRSSCAKVENDDERDAGCTGHWMLLPLARRLRGTLLKKRGTLDAVPRVKLWPTITRLYRYEVGSGWKNTNASVSNFKCCPFQITDRPLVGSGLAAE